LTIEEIATELGVSRTPVREAFQALATEGYLRITPHRAAIVREIGAEELADAYDVRAVVEGYSARLAAERATPEMVARLRGNCENLAKGISDYAVGRAGALDLLELNSQFHDLVHELSGNVAIGRVVASLWNLPKAYTRFYWESPERQRASLDFHAQLVDALAGRRATDASDIMRDHILEAKKFLLGWLQRGESSGFRGGQARTVQREGLPGRLAGTPRETMQAKTRDQS